MKSKSLFLRAAFAALIATVLVVLVAPAVAAEPDKNVKRRRGAFNLLRAASTLRLDVNRVDCGVDNQGNDCTQVTGSPVGGGGFWPGGSPNQYIFNSGLQIAGLVPDDAGFAWAGDTVGAYFFDATGGQPQGEQLTLIYSSATQEDADDWPQGGIIRDADIFEASLLGRNFISEEDSWVRYWDGNPSLLSNRSHPMGVMVEQRTLAWNFPSGNEDIIYFLYTFYNVTASDPSVYSGLCTPVPDSDLNCAAVEAEIAAVGARFQADNEARFGIDIPAGGYKFDSLFAAFAMDPDVGNASVNASTAILPFQMGVAYKTDFSEPNWLFPAAINGPPFGPYPGFIGVKYLKSPVNPVTGEQVGLTLFSNTTNGAPFPDPIGVSQLWRLLSGRISTAEGDLPCTIPNPVQRRLCTLVQDPRDTRFFQASGPFELNPGEAATIVVAFVHAAPIASEVIPFVNGVLAPGISPSGTEIATDPSLVRVLERASGWLGQNDDDGDGEISQDEVVTLERSLLRKSLVAQTLFDGGFALPSPPESPPFFLVAGENQVTVIWQASPTETEGDPFFSVAGDPASAAFDPNYRFNDVEGYRIYRGRSRAQLDLIAQFDYAGTSFIDYTAGWDYGNQCAPELNITGGCPIDFDGVNSVAHDLVGTIQQVPPGGRVELADGSVVTLVSNNSVEAAGGLPLTNTGVPFAFVDNSVRNSVDYFYSVSAFDVNSVKTTGLELTSLESGRQARAVTPRASAPNQVLPTLVTGLFGDDGERLNPGAPVPLIDAANGTFSGPFPPSNAFELGFAPLVQRLLPAFARNATIDSIVAISDGDNGDCPAGTNPFNACWHAFVSLDVSGTVTQSVLKSYTPWWGAFGESPRVQDIPFVKASVAFDATSLSEFDIPTEGFAADAVANAETNEAINNSSAEGPQNRRGVVDNTWHGGSRWFSGDNESAADPARFIRVGSLDGVDTVWAPISHTPADFGEPEPDNATVAFEKQCFSRAMAFMGRAADVRFTWQGGTFGEVRDLTHHVGVPFSGRTGASWGFLTTDGNGNGFLDWQDFNYVDGALQVLWHVGGGNCDAAAGSSWDPANALSPVSLSNTPTLMPVSTDGLFQTGIAGLSSTGQGFGLYVNGERYIFQVGSLPGDGTAWTLRTYSGTVSATDQNAADPSGYSYLVNYTGRSPGLRPPLIARLNFVFEAAEATTLAAFEPDMLDMVHTVPDPYYVTSGLEVTPGQKIIKFVNLPSQAIIRIYSVSGILVDVVEHNDASGGSEATWDVRNKNNQFVASGVYFYHVETQTGDEKIGRFTVVNTGGLATGQSVP